MKAPFPYFGGKSRVASNVWDRFGNVPNYVEPFFGSGAVLLGRQHEPGIETVNDLDGYISNFWRALQADPDGVAYYADWPVNENDLSARHIWLVSRRDDLQSRLEGDPDYFDVKIAGWWVWGRSCWIGSGFCSGKGPWQSSDGKMTKVGMPGTKRQMPHLGNAGMGVNPGRPHLKSAGMGVSRQMPDLGADKGVKRASIFGSDDLLHYMQGLAQRFRRVRVCCGDWSRVVGTTPTVANGVTGVFLDPPYSAESGREMGLYTIDSGSVAHDVRAWCEANANNPKLRIALCGYEGEGHDQLLEQGWTVHSYSAEGGYEVQAKGERSGNRHRERIWFSPHCLQGSLEL